MSWIGVLSESAVAGLPSGGIASLARLSHGLIMLPRSPLEDPETASVAWARYRKLMRWMMMFTTAAVAIALMLLYKQNGMVSIHLFIAAALGIALAMLLMSALMGLVFLSSGTGHDEIVTRDDEADSRRDRDQG